MNFKNKKLWIAAVLALVLPGGFIAAALIAIKKAFDKMDFNFEEEEE